MLYDIIQATQRQQRQVHRAGHAACGMHAAANGKSNQTTTPQCHISVVMISSKVSKSTAAMITFAGEACSFDAVPEGLLRNASGLADQPGHHCITFTLHGRAADVIRGKLYHLFVAAFFLESLVTDTSGAALIDV